MIPYAELNSRTYYSFHGAASDPAELVVRAIGLGYSALAITDRDGVYALPKAHQALKSRSSDCGALFKLIVGTELFLEGAIPLRLLCIDRSGYRLLCRLIAMSHGDSKKNRPVLAWSQLLEILEDPGSRGLIALVEGGEGYDYLALKEIFADRIFLTLTRSGKGEHSEQTQKVLRLSRSFQIPIVATQGSPSDLKSLNELTQLFSDLPEAIENTHQIAERCHFSLDELKYQYPARWLPVGETAQTFLEKLVWKGASEKYPTSISQATSVQIQRELETLKELQAADYFLGFWRIADFAKNRNILYQGRGAGTYSATAFFLGITALDSTQVDLPNFTPEIDIDFEHEGRDLIVQQLIADYGSENVARVATRTPRDAKVQGIDETQSSWRLSAHSGRFVVSEAPILESVPIELTSVEGSHVIQWDKDDLKSVEMLKIDVLPLEILTVLKKTFQQVQLENPQIQLDRIPMDDVETYEMIQRAQTIGVFLLETRTQMARLLEIRPRKFQDLVNEVSLFRSSPASVAFLAYVSAYLKCHYPAQSCCALLNSQPTGFYSPATLLEEAKRQGVRVKPVHLNHSEWDCSSEGKSLLLGWRSIPGIEKKEIAKVLEERTKGSFKSLSEFMTRVSLSPQSLYRLALAQVFSFFELTPTQALWEIFSRAVSIWAALEGENQLNLFRNLETSSKIHPLLSVKQQLLVNRKIPVYTSDQLRRIPHNKIISLAGLVIVSQKFSPSKGTRSATLEDEAGFMDLTFHEKTYEKYKALFESDPFMIITGRVDRTGDLTSFVVGHVEALFGGSTGSELGEI